MKRIHMILLGAPQVPPVFIAPGIWTQLDAADKVWLIVQNNTPNQNVEDFGGYNAIDIDPYVFDFPLGFSVSAKQYLTFATEWALTPPEGVLHNYRTLQECADAVYNATDIQGVMLFDNI